MSNVPKFAKGCHIVCVRGGDRVTDETVKITDPVYLSAGLWQRATQLRLEDGDVMVVRPRGSVKWVVYRLRQDHIWFSTGWTFIDRFHSKDAAIMAAVLLP